MKIKGVIFDFNGTLFFDNDKHILAWNEISKQIRHKKITEDELYNHFNGVPNANIIMYMKNQQATKGEIQEYSLLKEKYYRSFCKEDQKNFHLVKGSEEFFDFLKSKEIPFTIASASVKPNIDFFVESFQLNQWFDIEKIVYDNGSYENKVKMFQKAAELLKIEMKDILILEDSLSGIKNAFQSGCENIIVVCSKQQVDEFLKLPGVIGTIENFDEIYSIIKYQQLF